MSALFLPLPLPASRLAFPNPARSILLATSFSALFPFSNLLFVLLL